jgi:hypothetical protein
MPTILQVPNVSSLLEGGARTNADAGTEIVRVEVAPCDPGVTLDGESEHVGSGAAPATTQVSATALAKLPPVGGAIMMLAVVCAPAATVSDAASGFTEKSSVEIV